MARLFTSNGTVTDIRPGNGDRFTYNELKGIVGGGIEVVYLDFGDFMVINSEDHKSMRRQLNPAATYIYNKGTGCNDLIHGDVLICEKGELE